MQGRRWTSSFWMTIFSGAIVATGSSGIARAGFTADEVYLPAVGRITGQGGTQFYTTVWATNLSGAPISFTFDFLKQGQTNTNPQSFVDALAPGQTKIYENVVESQLGLSSALGAGRIVATGPILVSERIYSQPAGADVGATVGLFFAGVPKSFSIGPGESASIQGVNQGGAENFRYNFALVETSGAGATVNVQVFDAGGALLGQKAYTLLPYEQLQPNVAEVAPSIATINARITATVTGGAGTALIAGAQLANESQDSSGFEMSFRDSLLGGGGGGAGVSSLNGLTGAVSLLAGSNVTLTNQGNGIKIDVAGGGGGGAGVSSLNALTGALTLTAGSGISITPSGSSIGIAYTGGGSSGLTSVTHDASLAGAGTGASPLAIADGQVVRSLTVGATTFHDAVTLAAGSNVGLSPSGSTITINAAGFLLPFSGSLNSGNVLFSVTNSDGDAIRGVSDSGNGIYGESAHARAVFGNATTGTGGVEGDCSPSAGPGCVGVGGISPVGPAVEGLHLGSGAGSTNAGVYGSTSSTTGGSQTAPGATGVFGEISSSSPGGFSAGVAGINRGTAGSGVGVFGYQAGSGYAVYGTTGSSNGYAGYFNGKVSVVGTLSKGGGSFKIDDPIDPYNKYLYHSFVESPDMMNVYNGEATLDGNGMAVVELPRWFQALNRDFRYQLTALDTAQPALHVARRIENNRFTIAGGVPGAAVSWQVTGIRQDAFANAHRIPVEVEKSPAEKGLLLYPAEMGEPADRGIDQRAGEIRPPR